MQFHNSFNLCCSIVFTPSLAVWSYLLPSQTLSPGQEWEFVSADLHQLKLFWSSILGDHGAWKKALLNSSHRELVSGSPCMVEDHKFAETTKFLQSVLISTKWYLLMRICFSGKLPTALSGRKLGKKEEKTH